MSAIWGQILYNGASPDSMREHYDTHCKIDKINEVSNDNVLFACGIQYVTKEARYDKMPYYDEKNAVYFTSDCLIDNREELIEQLGLTGNGSDVIIPDGELIYRAYLKWGTDSFRRFRGLFSIAIYNTETKELILAVDQTSSRCLYYYCHQEGITFSTLIKPILIKHPDVTFNELYLKDYLIAPGLRPNIVSKDTPYMGIYKIDPGTYISITNGNVQEHTYWTPGMYKKNYHCHGAKQYGKCFMSIMKQAVHESLRADGEIGICQSSGLDSLTVGTLAATELAEHNKSLYAYTYVPIANESDIKGKHYIINEKADLELVAEKYPNMITHFMTNDGKECYSEIPKILDVLEFPYKSFPNSPSLYEIYEQAGKAGCKIVLSGQYGNSTVSYGKIDDIIYDLMCRRKYITAGKYLNRYSKIAKESRKKNVSFFIKLYRYARKEYKKEEVEIPKLSEMSNYFLSEDILNNYPLKERFIQGQVPSMKRLPTPQKIYKAYLHMKEALTYIGEIETKMGLKHGVVLRDPTRDVQILELCNQLPYQYFSYNGTPRWLIRGNMQDYIAKEILSNWMRYGVQNSDWLYRFKINQNCLFQQIRKDIEKLANEIICNGEDKIQLTDWIKTSDINILPENVKTPNIWENYNYWIDILSICVISKFINKKI